MIPSVTVCSLEPLRIAACTWLKILCFWESQFQNLQIVDGGVKLTVASTTNYRDPTFTDYALLTTGMIVNAGGMVCQALERAPIKLATANRFLLPLNKVLNPLGTALMAGSTIQSAYNIYDHYYLGHAETNVAQDWITLGGSAIALAGFGISVPIVRSALMLGSLIFDAADIGMQLTNVYSEGLNFNNKYWIATTALRVGIKILFKEHPEIRYRTSITNDPIGEKIGIRLLSHTQSSEILPYRTPEIYDRLTSGKTLPRLAVCVHPLESFQDDVADYLTKMTALNEVPLIIMESRHCPVRSRLLLNRATLVCESPGGGVVSIDRTRSDIERTWPFIADEIHFMGYQFGNCVNSAVGKTVKGFINSNRQKIRIVFPKHLVFVFDATDGRTYRLENLLGMKKKWTETLEFNLKSNGWHEHETSDDHKFILKNCDRTIEYVIT